MSQVADDVVAFCRFFASFERDAICCGTVTVAQCVLLQALRGGPMDVSSLADQLSVTPGAVTRLVDGVAKSGLVGRQRDPQDRRRVEVFLTAEGESEAQRLYDLTVAAVGTILARVPADERDQVIAAVHTLRNAVEALPV